MCRDNKKKLIIGMSHYTATYALLSLINITVVLANPIISFDDSSYTKRFIQVDFFMTANALRSDITGKSLTKQYQWMMIFSVIPKLMYNGKREGSKK